jgi:SAM-dependent methyltransferase
MEVFRFDDHSTRQLDQRLRGAWWFDRQMPATQLVGMGYCSLCDACVQFELVDGANADAPNLREESRCPKCGCNPRVRAGLTVLRDLLAGQAAPRVYLTEQATPTFAWVQRNLWPDVLGSEFEPSLARRLRLTAYLASLGGHGQVGFGDVTRLGFGDATLDAVASFEVLEHVPEYDDALREFARVLRPGGTLLATFPFLDAAASVVRARLDAGGGIEHLLPAEYHGDPLGAGVLCFHHFGWDVLDRVRAAGFSHAQMIMPFAPSEGLPYGLWTLLASR